MLAQWVPSLGEHKSGEQRQFFLRTLIVRSSRGSHEMAKAHHFTPLRGTLSAKTGKTAATDQLGGAQGERLRELAFWAMRPSKPRRIKFD